MSRRSIDVELLCDICSLNFDLNLCRPKVLPCGHTICKKCLHNPALERKCPTCRKDLAVGPEDHPDNVFIIRMMTDESDGSPPRKVPKKENAKLQQLQRGLELGRQLVQQLQQLVPTAVEALNRQMESWVAQVRQLEEAVEREAAGGEQANTQELTTEQLKLMAKLEDSVRLLTNDKCSVVAEGGECTWRASVQPGQFGNILHLLLLQLRADGPLEKVDDVADSTNRAAFVGPPLISTLSIDNERDIADGVLKVKDILRDVSRWQNIRSLRNLSGSGSERLLRVVAPHLQELEFSDSEEVFPLVMEEVKEMTALKRLSVRCDDEMAVYPDLPFQLEELAISSPCKSHLYNVQCMPGLRSLLVEDYLHEDVSFPRPLHGGLLWLSVAINVEHGATLRSLVRAHAQSLQELQIYCAVNDQEKCSFYFPDLPQLLGTCGFQALRRLVLVRSNVVGSPCEEVDACLLQRRAIRKLLPSSVDVICNGCLRSVF